MAANCMDPQMHIDTTQYRKGRNGNLYGSANAHRYDTVSESSELDFVWIRKRTSISEVSEVRRIGVFKLRKVIAHHQIYPLMHAVHVVDAQGGTRIVHRAVLPLLHASERRDNGVRRPALSAHRPPGCAPPPACIRATGQWGSKASSERASSTGLCSTSCMHQSDGTMGFEGQL